SSVLRGCLAKPAPKKSDCARNTEAADMNYANTMAVRYTDWRIKLNPVIGWAVLLSLVLLPVALWSDAPYVLNILAYTYLFAGLASAWNLIGGIGGQF